jgi:hypothetical protein
MVLSQKADRMLWLGFEENYTVTKEKKVQLDLRSERIPFSRICKALPVRAIEKILA